MGKRRNKAASPSAWLRIDPYTGEVTRKQIEGKSTPGQSFGERSRSSASSSTRASVTCPDCGVAIRASRLGMHLRENCPKRFAKGVAPCPTCGEQILAAQLGIHVDSCRQRPQIERQSAALRRPDRRPPPVESVSIAHERTGVFADDGSFVVLYRGQTIAVAGSAKQGWEMLDDHRRKVEQG